MVRALYPDELFLLSKFNERDKLSIDELCESYYSKKDLERHLNSLLEFGYLKLEKGLYKLISYDSKVIKI